MSTRFDIRVDGETIFCHDDAASVIYLLGKLITADDVYRVLLAAEATRDEMTEAGTWNLSPDFAALAESFANNP